jgi:hypothetical protein
MKRFLIAIQHVLSDSQIAELTNGTSNVEFVLLKEVNPELFTRVANCPSDITEIHKLANDFLLYIDKYEAVVLPIGSPIFMMDLGIKTGIKCHATDGEWSGPDMYFSHTDRVSVDEPQADGSMLKKSVFQHVKFNRL